MCSVFELTHRKPTFTPICGRKVLQRTKKEGIETNLSLFYYACIILKI